MKKDNFVDIMGQIDNDMIEQVDKLRNNKGRAKKRWFSYVAIAACLTLVASAGIAYSLQRSRDATGIQQVQTIEEPKDAEETHTDRLGKLEELSQFPPEVSARLQLLDFSAVNFQTLALPSVAPYDVDTGLSNLINLNMFYLSEEEVDQLEENLFVVRPSYQSEFFETYEHNRYAQVPNFVTVDSMMHTYHLYFSLLLNRTEKNYLAGELLKLSQQMLEVAMDQYAALSGTQWEAAACRAVAFFAVAASLQDQSTQVPEYAAELVKQELQQIYASAGIAISELSEDFVDYSQYKPRGYYEGDDELERYFRAMMWYGQVNFAQDQEVLNRCALLINCAMAQDGLQRWERIYTVTAFFAGTSDDLGYYEYAPIIEQAYGGYPSIEALICNEDAYIRYVEEIEKLSPPVINSVPVYMFEEGDLGAMNKGFRFMGQRFTIDAAVMQQLVYRAVEGTNEEGHYRMLPDTLDIAAALGSDTAMQLLEEQGETAYGGYPENMAELREVLENAPQDTWTTSLYSSWLYTLMPLLEERGEGYPAFMTTAEWTKKRLETFAGSYTELKHDTVLYAKQMIAEMGGGPSEELDDRGYVEPEPEVYRRFMLLAQQTADGLHSFGLISAEDMENLSRLAELARRLMVISEKELQDQLLTEEEYDLIRDYGGTLEHFWIEAVEDRTDSAYLEPKEIPASLVTDIATDPNGWVLQVANSKPAEILVVVSVEGNLRLASGVVYNFYQFEQPISERLSDTEWRQIIGEWAGEDGYYKTEELEKPWWTQSYWSKR